MKYILVLLVFVWPMKMFAALDVQMHNCCFYEPGSGPYVETYLSIYAKSINYQKLPSGQYGGKLAVTLFFKKGDKIVTFKKYQLNTHPLSDLTTLNFNEIDLKRTSLDTGKYEVELQINNAEVEGEVPVNLTEQVTVPNYSTDLSISSIELVSGFRPAEADKATALTKSGFDITPYVIDFYPATVDTLSFYAEIYHSEKAAAGKPYLLQYAIYHAEKKYVISNTAAIMKMEPEEVTPLLHSISIAQVPSGNYFLAVEIRNQENKTLTFKTISFQRSKTVVADNSTIGADDIDLNYTFVSRFTTPELLYHIRSLRPVSNPEEVIFIDNMIRVKQPDSTRLRRFLYNYWTEKNSADPLSAFLDYQKQLEIVQSAFKTQIDYGFQTDRGRVYLKYGPPNDRTVSEHESNAAPYEIWTYYHLGTQTNVKFIFYQPDLVSNRYRLLHSDARNEIQNPNWRYELKKAGNGAQKIDDNNVRQNWGDRIDQNLQR